MHQDKALRNSPNNAYFAIFLPHSEVAKPMNVRLAGGCQRLRDMVEEIVCDSCVRGKIAAREQANAPIVLCTIGTLRRGRLFWFAESAWKICFATAALLN